MNIFINVSKAAAVLMMVLSIVWYVQYYSYPHSWLLILAAGLASISYMLLGWLIYDVNNSRGK